MRPRETYGAATADGAAATACAARRGRAALAALALTALAACGDSGAARPSPAAGPEPHPAAVPQPAAAAANTEGGVCGRTPQVRDALVAATRKPDCASVAAADLASVFDLDLSGPVDLASAPPIRALRAGDFQGLSQLGLLILRGNQLTALPPGIFAGLVHLNTLDLAENRLGALDPAVFAGLSQLWTLSLAGNQLAALPPGVFDGTPALLSLDVSYNRLTEWPAAALRGLQSLDVLWLAENRLTALPAGALAPYPVLRTLDLSRNLVAELPDGAFRGAAGLTSLWLSQNPGSPFAISVDLERAGEDPAAPGSVRLRAVVAVGAPFAVRARLEPRGGVLSASQVVVPAGRTASSEVTATNAPGSSFSVRVRLAPPTSGCGAGACYDGFDLVAGPPLVLANPPSMRVTAPAVHLVQATQSLDGRVPLVAGRPALLRVFATSDSANAFRAAARATFFLDGRAAYTVSLEAPAGGIPTEVAPGRLERSFNARVPGAFVQPGAEMVVELDPDHALPLASGSTRRIPAEGRAQLDARSVRPFDLTVVPVQYLWTLNADNNAAVVATARDFATAASAERLRFVRALLPLAEVNAKVREPYFTAADTSELGGLALLEEIQLLRHIEAGGSEEHYHGIFAAPRFVRRDAFWSFLGVAFQPGYSGLSLSHRRDGEPDPEFELTLAHELGHNLALGHAPCGGPDGVDEAFPYLDGSIGAWGYEFGGRSWPGRLIDPARHVDLMSYCRPYWISDYNFAKALAFRAERAGSARPGRPVRSLLLWGGVRNGRLRLAPALVWDAPPKLPARPGPYRLAGFDARGAELFSLSFEPDMLDHGAGRSFLFALPFRPAWERAVQAIVLRGPEGVAVVEASDSRRLAVFTTGGGVTGGRGGARIRGIVRDWGGVVAPGLAASGAVDVSFGWPGPGAR